MYEVKHSEKKNIRKYFLFKKNAIRRIHKFMKTNTGSCTIFKYNKPIYRLERVGNRLIKTTMIYLGGAT